MGPVLADDKYSGALEVGLGRSLMVPAFVGGAGAASLAVLAFTPVPLALGILLGTWVCVVGLDALRRALVIHRLAISLGGEVTVDGRAGTLRAGSFVAPWLTVVRWRPAGTRFDRTLLVVPDMLGADAFRELRVILRQLRGQTT
jgi:hypothetical protein